MLKKFQNFMQSAPGLAIDASFLEFWEFFLSITVFCEYQGWKFWNYLSIAVFCEVQATKHCYAQVS